MRPALLFKRQDRESFPNSLGLHFTNSVPIMRLLEFVNSIATSDEALDICKEFGKSLGKTVIIARDTPGFIVDYLQYLFRLNAIRMLERGLATKEDIRYCSDLGFRTSDGTVSLTGFGWS
jgi:3-hydroxybutyryl-CoA dehydrogenase